MPVTIDVDKVKKFAFKEKTTYTKLPFASITRMRSSTGMKPRCVTTLICKDQYKVKSHQLIW